MVVALFTKERVGDIDGYLGAAEVAIDSVGAHRRGSKDDQHASDRQQQETQHEYNWVGIS